MNRVFFFIAACLISSSCISVPKPVAPSVLLWPPPPEKTLVEYVGQISTDIDIAGKRAADRIFGDSGSLFFGKPHDVAADAAGNIYISDTKHHAVFVINPSQKKIGRITNPFGFKTPVGVAVDDTNSLMAVADSSYGRVFVFELPSLALSFQVGQWDELKRPVGVAFDPARKRIYVGDSKKHEIYSFDFRGKLLSTVASRGSEPGQVYFPGDMASDDSGALYVVDSMNFRVQVFYPDGKPPRIIGRQGDASVRLSRPKGVAMGPRGEVLVTDAGTSSVRIFDVRGGPVVSVGDKGDDPGEFNLPQGVFADKKGALYVVDQANRRLQIFRLIEHGSVQEQSVSSEKND